MVSDVKLSFFEPSTLPGVPVSIPILPFKPVSQNRVTIANVLQGQGQPATGPLWPQHWAYDSSIQPYAYDPEFANRYFRALVQADRVFHEFRARFTGKVSPVRLAPDGDLARWTEDFMRLEASGWKGKAGSALSCREDDRRFVAAVFPEAFRRGRLQITGLDLDGRPLARHCMLTHGEGAFCFKIAYDETYASCSPGILGEVDNVGQFLEMPGLRWLDSNTAPENNHSYARVWKDSRTMQCVAVGARAAGALAVAALPLLRFGKSLLKK